MQTLSAQSAMWEIELRASAWRLSKSRTKLRFLEIGIGGYRLEK